MSDMNEKKIEERKLSEDEIKDVDGIATRIYNNSKDSSLEVLERVQKACKVANLTGWVDKFDEKIKKAKNLREANENYMKKLNEILEPKAKVFCYGCGIKNRKCITEVVELTKSFVKIACKLDGNVTAVAPLAIKPILVN